MKITNRNRTRRSGFSVVKSDKRIPLKYDIAVLDLMCAYTISENAYIRKSALMNLRNLVHLLDLDYYANDPEKMRRISFIKAALSARLTKGLKDPDSIVNYANGGILNDSSYIPCKVLSTEELNWLDENVSESLKYTYLYDNADELYYLLGKFINGDFTDRSKIVSQLEQKITDVQQSFRRSRTESAQAQMFSLRGDRYDNALSDIYERAINPNRKLMTGMQGINILTHGGFECRRVYGFFGSTGVGKSVTLLNLAYQIKKYNRGFRTKDPTKTPVIVFLTMENDVDETVKRLYSIATGAGPDEFNNIPLDEIKQKLISEGELYLSDDNPIDIVIKYVPSGGVDTTYLYSLVEELEDDGYETIAFFLDHLKKIRSANYKNVDIRIELGEIVNELKAFAIIKDIPVITCSHLNRDASAKMELAEQHHRADATKLLGKSTIGESMLILDNIDFGYMIHTEYDVAGIKYLCVSNTKKRDYLMMDYVVLPFDSNSQIKLMEDFYLDKPLFKDTVGATHEFSQKQVTTSQYTNIMILDDDDDDIFNGATSYAMVDEPLTADIAPPEPQLIPCIRFVSNPSRREDIASFCA